MFIGHYGVGLGAKKYAPGVSLGLLFIAVQFADLLWPWLLIFKVEHVALRPGTNMFNFIDFPYSHSLFMIAIWSVLFGGVYWLFKKDARAAIVLGICVLSHWILDFIVHFSDLPLYPGSTHMYGLGLWASRPGTLVAEFAFLFGGLYLYLKSTKPKNNRGKWGLWVLIFLLVSLYLMTFFGPPPTGVDSVGWEAQSLWIFVILAFWVDKNRALKHPEMIIAPGTN